MSIANPISITPNSHTSLQEVAKHNKVIHVVFNHRLLRRPYGLLAMTLGKSTAVIARLRECSGNPHSLDCFVAFDSSLIDGVITGLAIYILGKS